MTDQITLLLENYKDGVPVKIERGSVVFICVAAIITVAISTILVKYIKKL